MIRLLGVAAKTRKPLFAAFEFNGDNINFAVVMSASRLSVNVRAGYFYIVNLHKIKTPLF